MSIITARSTKKYFTGNDLLSLFPDNKGDFLPLIEELIRGYHPLPPIYITLGKVGDYTLLGDYSHNIVETISQIIKVHSTTATYRCARKYAFDVVIFEPSTPADQTELIAAYQQLGFC